MIDVAPLFHGFATVLTPYHLALMAGGVLLGILVGVLPGLGAPGGPDLPPGGLPGLPGFPPKK